ncbi:MAG: 50S ribosomal protein L3 [bacterium]|nr:50S ribosomal protein L3 [bacterium]
MEALIGKKLGMTRVFTENGNQLPVTVIEVSPNVVQQVKTVAKDGYSAVQLGYGQQKPQRVNRALTGHFSAAKKGLPRVAKEVRITAEEEAGHQVGDELTVGQIFQTGQKVDICGTTIGKGYAGVVKRHGMSGVQTVSHGTHEYFRHGGSIGCRKFPGRVFKNKRMAGQMGNVRVTQEGLEIVGIREEDNAILIKGSIPGAKNSTVILRHSRKCG